jgi:single-strand DNA-binding protein
MASFNKVLLMGNLTRDPEMRQLPSGQNVCTLRLAVSRPYKTASGENREDTLFVDVTAWGRQAENSNTYLRKGSSVFIEGSLRLEQWEDKATGQQRQRHSVTAERVQFMNSAQRSNEAPPQGSAPQNNFAQPAPQAPQQPAQAYQAAQPVKQAYQEPAQQSAPVYQAPTPQQAPVSQAAYQASAPAAQPVQQVPPAPSFDTDDIDDDIPF